MVTVEQIFTALSTVNDPEIHKDLVTLKMVKDVRVDGPNVFVTVELTTPACPLKHQIREEATAAIRALGGIEDVAIEFTAQVRTIQAPTALPGIAHVIAVGSGKGGVGKSTVAANLSLALAQTGARVGLLDADIYGPSIPLMLGVQGAKPSGEGQTIFPIAAHGLKVMSIGFLLPSAEDPVIWRGPMLAGVLNQFLRQVQWGDLDYLLVDLPPGTGDIPLSLVQSIPLSGAVIVITPQQVASAIGVKTLRMFQGERTRVPILGIIENMSAFECPHCHERTEIFDEGGGAFLAEREGVPFLGSLPLDPAIRSGGDRGLPVVLEATGSPAAAKFREIAGALAGRISVISRANQPVLSLPVL
ncbi:MAG: P-loop NTPase [Cyanobacteria bacterium REEB65]|nr:P-loop NTPase [Cyanobacteria bacterium REEB65]